MKFPEIDINSLSEKSEKEILIELAMIQNWQGRVIAEHISDHNKSRFIIITAAASFIVSGVLCLISLVGNAVRL
jgi:hypothetical protein